MRTEDGQASIEWLALVTAIALLLGVVLPASRVVDGRSFGGAVAHRIVCAVKGGCDDGDRRLRAVYGDRDAALVRRHLQGLVFEPGERQLPVDWRACRAVSCAVAPDDRDLDAHRTADGLPVTAFTRLQHRGGRRYVQYWFYYPESNTAWAGSDKLWNNTPFGAIAEAVAGVDGYPGWHADDWEGATVRLDPNGRVAVRATSHGHWQWCKQRDCAGRWGPATGWVRVSRGSHAGHIPVTAGRVALGRRPARGRRPSRSPVLPGRGLRERTATAEGIRLLPLEGIDRRRYRRLDPGISPPWQKDAYANPDSPGA